MEYRLLHLTDISAEELDVDNQLSKMGAYVVVFLSTDPCSQQKTPVDSNDGKSPKWSHSFELSVPDNRADPPPVLNFLLRSQSTCGDCDIGRVHVPIKELLDIIAKGDAGASHLVRYPVRKSSGEHKGVLNFSFKFGDNVDLPVSPPAPASMKGGEHVLRPPPAAWPRAYPLPPHGAAPYPGPVGFSYPYLLLRAAYPPLGPLGQAYTPPVGYGYSVHPPPPHAGYGYPPPPQGYGYGYGVHHLPQHAGYGYPPPPHGYGYGYEVHHPPQHAGYGYPPPRLEDIALWAVHDIALAVVPPLILADNLDANEAGFDDYGDSGFDDYGNSGF